MAVMMVNLRLNRPAEELEDAVLAGDAWKQAAEHGLRESAVFVDPDDPTQVTVQTRWRNLAALRKHGETLTERLVSVLDEQGLSVLDEPHRQVRVSPWNAPEGNA